MGINRFTDEQLELLKHNPYVVRVSETTITYSEEFKQEFIAMYKLGKLPTEIFRHFGFDTKILKERRITEFARRCKQYELRVEGTKDTRGLNSGRPKTKDLTSEEQIERLKHKNLVLEQEIDFLKKMIFLSKKTKWEKSQRKRNTKS